MLKEAVEAHGVLVEEDGWEAEVADFCHVAVLRLRTLAKGEGGLQEEVEVLLAAMFLAEVVGFPKAEAQENHSASEQEMIGQE